MDEKIEKKMIRFKNDIWYSITINPDDDCQYQGKPDRFFKLKQLMFLQRVNWFMGVADMILYPDLSYPERLIRQSYPRMHYHGIIKFNDVLKFLLSTTIHRSCQVEIDTIEDLEYWTAYCKKFMKYTNTKERALEWKTYFNPKDPPSMSDGRINLKTFLENYDRGSAR